MKSEVVAKTKPVRKGRPPKKTAAEKEASDDISVDECEQGGSYRAAGNNNPGKRRVAAAAIDEDEEYLIKRAPPSNSLGQPLQQYKQQRCWNYFEAVVYNLGDLMYLSRM